MTIDVISGWIYWILIVIAVCFFAYGTFCYALGYDGPERISKANRMMLFGGGCILLAFAIKFVIYISNSGS